MIDAKAGHNILQSRLDAALQSCGFFFYEECERLGAGGSGGSRCCQRQQVNLALRGRISVISIIDSTLTPPKGHDPHFQKGIGGYIQNALHSFLFAFGAHQVWPPWHLPKCCSEILSITGLEVSEGISNRAWTHGLHRRINRYLTPQTVISHHEARLSANSLCPVLQIYGALYK